MNEGYTQLTTAEVQFLLQHGLSPNDVLDARYMNAKSRKAAAKSSGVKIILGSPCRAARHRLRTRAGHCVQCDTSKLAYQARYETVGVVYIAISQSRGLIKVGGTESIADRIDSLRAQSYAGANDWSLKASAEVKDYARVENDIRRRLSSYRASASYEKNGRTQKASEIFECDYSVVKKVFDEIVR